MMALFSVISTAAIVFEFSMALVSAHVLSHASSALLTSAGEGPSCTLYVSINLSKFVHATMSSSSYQFKFTASGPLSLTVVKRISV